MMKLKLKFRMCKIRIDGILILSDICRFLGEIFIRDIKDISEGLMLEASWVYQRTRSKRYREILYCLLERILSGVRKFKAFSFFPDN